MACVELFAAYGVPLTPRDTRLKSPQDLVYSGVMGFVGRGLVGTCVLIGEVAPLEASCPDGGRLRDWVGELANQLVGRLKVKLLGRGLPVVLSTPLVFSSVRIEPMPRGNLKPAAFDTPRGTIVVWVEVEADEKVALDSERPSGVGTEGDILIF